MIIVKSSPFALQIPFSQLLSLLVLLRIRQGTMGDHLQVQQQQQQLEMRGGLDLPPGFRFHPTDEEIITFYLTPKVLETAFCSTAIGEVDLNKSEPWDLPSKAKMGEKEWYFYCHKDRKYPTGMRTNRATEAGYWKATGKDKEIYRPQRQLLLVGMKKTLVFYKGRAPRGEKTNWVMHEYRLEGSSLHLLYPINSTTNNTSASSKDEWVVCRIFHKSSGIKKVPSYHMAMLGGGGGINDQRSIPMPMPMGDQEGFPVDSATCTLPPLMDPSSLYATTAGVITSSVAPPASSSYLAADPSLAGVELHMNGQYLGNPMAAAQAQPMFYQQIMGAAGGFMTGPASGPSSMVSQDTELSNEQNNAVVAEISSVNRGMDGMWKY